MEPYQQRVVDEKKALDEKIANLSEFIQSSGVFSSLPTVEMQLLLKQEQQMREYSATLQERIALFK